jgi:hypothetical protein
LQEAKDSSDAIDAIEEFIGMGDGEGAIPVAEQISNAINALDVNTVGGTRFYIDSIKEENGLIIPTSKILVEPNDHVLTYTDGGITSTISIAKLTETEVLNLGESNVKEAYKELFAEGKAVIGKGEATLLLRTERYVTVEVKGATYQKDGEKATTLGVLKLHFGKVGKEWYLMSKVDLQNGGNKVSINEFNQEVSSTILKINDTTVRGFSLKVSSKDAKQQVIDYLNKIIAVNPDSAKAVSDDFFA